MTEKIDNSATFSMSMIGTVNSLIEKHFFFAKTMNSSIATCVLVATTGIKNSFIPIKKMIAAIEQTIIKHVS